MTPEQQRIKIAEALGFTKPEYQPFKEDHWFSPEGMSTLLSQLPDFLNDLNAIHEATIQCLTDPAQKRCFAVILALITDPDWRDNTVYGDDDYPFPTPDTVRYCEYVERPAEDTFEFQNAPATLRCEALLRTLQLYEDQ